MWHSSVSRYHGSATKELYVSAATDVIAASVIVARPHTRVTFTIATNTYRDNLLDLTLFFSVGHASPGR